MLNTVIVFDEIKKRYLADESGLKVHSTRMSETDYARIEAALIKFADNMRIAN